jgi:predicted enzyme related to lactoylglutathione lyase
MGRLIVKVRGVNRIAIGVTDLDEAIAHYGKLLNTHFEVVPPEFSQPMGSNVAISWEAGIELVAPLPGAAGEVIGLLPKKQGLMGVVFNVDDVDEAARNAGEMGISVAREIRLNVEQMNAVFGGRVTRFEEISFDAKSGIPMVLGEITLSEDA